MIDAEVLAREVADAESEATRAGAPPQSRGALAAVERLTRGGGAKKNTSPRKKYLLLRDVRCRVFVTQVREYVLESKHNT